MPKPEGLFSIAEISAVCGVSIDMLRFYETKALISPAYTDPESSYRYYSREKSVPASHNFGAEKHGVVFVGDQGLFRRRKACGEKDNRADRSARHAQPGYRESANSRHQSWRSDSM